jgi:hypothetical protein
MDVKLAWFLALVTLPALSYSQNVDFKESLGETISIQGTAINRKLGAQLMTSDSSFIWIDGLLSWPSEYYSGEYNGKTLKVKGVVIERFDLPVFVEKEGETKSGIPVPEGTDLKEASHRFLLKSATWEIVVE